MPTRMNSDAKIRFSTTQTSRRATGEIIPQKMATAQPIRYRYFSGKINFDCVLEPAVLTTKALDHHTGSRYSWDCISMGRGAGRGGAAAPAPAAGGGAARAAAGRGGGTRAAE